MSDVHSSRDSRDQALIAEAMIDDVARLHDDRPIDIVVFSGDLADKGTPEEFELGRDLVLLPTLERLGLGRERLVVVPGNHDISRSGITRATDVGLQALLTGGSSEEARSEFAELRAAGPASMDLGRLSAYDSFFASLYEDSSAEIESAGLLTRVHWMELGARRIAVVGLNSAWRCTGGAADKGRLVVGRGELDAASALVEGSDFTMFVVHHPLDWLVDWDANDLRRAFEGARSLVLSGHEHVPNPTAEISARGGAVYVKAGCLYQAPDYFNGYSVLDVDDQGGFVTVHLRTWWAGEHDRHEFGAAENVAEHGIVHLPWAQLPAQAAKDVSFTDVLDSLADVLDRRGLVRHGDTNELDVTERLVPPRFWPLPYTEVTALRVEKRDPNPSDPLNDLVEEGRAVLVCGDHQSGVSSALVWLLAQSYSSDAARIPVFVSIEGRLDRDRLDRAVRTELARLGVALAKRDAIPPVTVAIDDLDPADTRSMQRLAVLIRDRSDWRFVLGTHHGSTDEFEAVLRDSGITLSAVHLGPLGRRELRQLVVSTVGAGRSELVDRALAVIVGQKLPRNPLTMSALVVVLADQPQTAVINQSALLEAYVGLFLGSNEATDLSRVGVDHRRRVHLLGWFASQLSDRGVTGVQRLQAEADFGEYFRARGLTTVSPGRVLDDLIRRSVLRDTFGFVDFRFPALLDLFKAKWMQEDEGADFMASVIADPILHRGAVEHYSGLKRDSRVLLERIGEVLSEAVEALDASVTVDMFDAVRNRAGWASELPGVERLSRLTSEPPEIERDDASLDEEFESLAVDMDARQAGHPDAADDFYSVSEHVEVLRAVTLQLGTVLRNSELVSDLALRRDKFIQLLRAWSLLAVAYAIEEEFSSKIADRLARLTARDGEVVEAGEQLEEMDSLDRVVETVLVLSMSVSVTREVSSPNLEQVAGEVLDDPEFMADTAPAMFATFCYALMQFDGWPARLAALHAAHGDHPIVARLAEGYALAVYRYDPHYGKDVREIEQWLTELYLSRAGVTRGTSGRERSAKRESIATRLRESRTERQRTVDVEDAPLGGLLLDGAD